MAGEVERGGLGRYVTEQTKARREGWRGHFGVGMHGPERGRQSSSGTSLGSFAVEKRYMMKKNKKRVGLTWVHKREKREEGKKFLAAVGEKKEEREKENKIGLKFKWESNEDSNPKKFEITQSLITNFIQILH